ncbi:fasciclin domain-containing protein [Phocaeicola plebeius]|uniref:fasciclin domain-containing protein n=1 Tax=Phocaeicola plebeius TaxID=310297 RepID=UPI0026F35BEB|nr:fasciclin domain-containing protein [Phocaeicola plebeius]
MRKFYFYLIGMLLTFVACSEETEITPPSKGEEEVKEIVSVLEENDEISDFVEVLKNVNVADLEEDELTVFAVRNSSAAASRSTVLDSASIKRHIAKGRYGKVDLTDGKVLESISGESLYVTRAGEDIYINGVVIEGEAIQAGNSYVYVVPEVMEQQSEPVNVYVTTINVYAINQGNSAKSPLKDVTVVVNKAKKDSLGIIYTKGDSLGVWKTDEQGQVVVKHTEKLIAFNVYKADYSDKYDNYLLGGIDNTGKFMYVDLNGDGKFTKEDKVDFALPYYVDYENNTKASTKTVYMTTDIAEPEVPEELPDADSVRVAWKDVLTDYMRYNVEAESKLVQGYANFDYSQVVSLSDSLWNKAYNLVNKGNQFVDMLSNSTEEQYFELKQNILVDLSLVYTQLYGYYGQMVDRGSVIPEEQLIEQMESLSMYVNGNRRYALSVMLAKVHLLRQDWQGAAYYCEEVIASDAYRLESQLDHTMVSSSESKEVIYGDFYANGKYIHPLLYKEVLIMAAYANFKMGTINKALQFVNELLASYGYAPVSIDEVEGTLQEFVAKLYGTGQSYPYARILSMKFGVNGFETPKNWFLPVPESALLSCPNLRQNLGY